MSSSLLLVAPYIRVLFRSGRLLKRSILPRIRSHALISCYQEIRGVHYTICYISSFSKISLSHPTSRNPNPLGAKPRSRSERDCKGTKIILTPATPRGKFSFILIATEACFAETRSPPSLVCVCKGKAFILFQQNLFPTF